MAVENEIDEVRWGQRTKAPSDGRTVDTQALPWAFLDKKVLSKHTVCFIH